MRITALAGGVGGARFLRGLADHLASASRTDAELAGASVTVVVNTGDDATMHGLRICPDIDTVMYTLAEAVHEEQGWGRREEAFTIAGELAAYREALGHDLDWASAWFTLGDRDLATHLYRTQLLREGLTLSQAVARLSQRWRPASWPATTVLPMSDEDAQTHVHLVDGGSVHFQEWWVRLRASVAATGFSAHDATGAPSTAVPAPGVLESIAGADVVLLPPSNPVVSIGTILALPGVREAIASTSAPVVGVSPILGGSVVRGMADACLSALGVPTTAAAVGSMYADLLDVWLVDDTADGGLHGTTIGGGHAAVIARPLLMRTRDAAASLAAAALEAALALRAGGLR